VADANRPLNATSGTLLVSLIVVAVLYFSRTVLIPLALALLLAFLLAPLSIRLRRWGFGRLLSAISVVTLSFAVLGVLGLLVVSQLADLGRKLPEYQRNIQNKLESVRASGGGFVAKMGRTARSISDELTPAVPPSAGPRSGQEKPVPVEIRPSAFSPFDLMQKSLGSILAALLTAVIVIVLALFILIEREDLRDRVVRLAGPRRVNLTTQVLDDAAYRVSRYLLAQLVVNAGFGALVGVGLLVLGIPNPFLWGVLTALFRYIPYLGIWIAAAMPAAVALAVEPGWFKLPVIFGLYLSIDLLMTNVLEPLVYGSTTGLSPLAVLVAAVFWTWLWGPVGLLLATPLTVCVVVIGRHVHNLEFLQVLLSDEPTLPPETRFYQRLLAREPEEAEEVAEEFLKGKSLEELFDGLIAPALALAEQDRHRGRLDSEREQFLFQNTRLLIENLSEPEEAAGAGDKMKAESSLLPPQRPLQAAREEGRLQVLCVPARDEADALGALMLARLLEGRGLAAQAMAAGTLAGESLERVRCEQPETVCVVAIPPFGFLHARYLCRRLQTQLPTLKLVCAILTEGPPEELKQHQPPLTAGEVASSLRQAVAQLLALLPLVTPEQQPLPNAA
jgi:predicted PurR-regulated permease PerM